MYFVDTFYNSLNKHGEELCGDHVEIVTVPDGKIMVLADGMGSGVKANILATMTSKIAATMLREGSSLEETIDTIVHTLPVCNERHLAYSTFTIIKAFHTGEVYAAEFDNPSIFLLRDGEDVPIEKVKKVINDKIIFESSFKLDEKSLLVAVSDGVVHAGVGKSLALGWRWNNVNEFLKPLSAEDMATLSVTNKVLNECQNLYENEPGDDTTVLAVKLRELETINLFTGPPLNPDKDEDIIEKILSQEGKVVVCGGTTAGIVSKKLGKEMEIDLSTMTNDIPPAGRIEGIELVTEGVITINKTISIIKNYMNPEINRKTAMQALKANNAAAMLARLLIERCDKLNIWVGQAVNPVHQESDYPMGIIFKMNQIKELANITEKLGKEVKLMYI